MQVCFGMLFQHSWETFKWKASRKDSKVEIPSASQFKIRSAPLFLFIVLHECVYFVIARGSWDGNCSVERDRLRQKKHCCGSPFFLFFWSQHRLQESRATVKLISCS